MKRPTFLCLSEAILLTQLYVTSGRNWHKKTAKHSRSKDQLLKLSEQVHERTRRCEVCVKTILEDDILSVSKTMKRWRRVMNQEKLFHQMFEEGKKASNLWHVELIPECIS